jgi:hypothetical protein
MSILLEERGSDGVNKSFVHNPAGSSEPAGPVWGQVFAWLKLASGNFLEESPQFIFLSFAPNSSSLMERTKTHIIKGGVSIGLLLASAKKEQQRGKALATISGKKSQAKT